MVCAIYYFNVMREAGFEPAHPEIVGLKSLGHSREINMGAPYGARTRDPGLIRPKF